MFLTVQNKPAETHNFIDGTVLKNGAAAVKNKYQTGRDETHYKLAGPFDKLIKTKCERLIKETRGKDKMNSTKFQ